MPRRASLIVFLGLAVAFVFVTGISAGAAPGDVQEKRDEVASAQDRLADIRMEASAAQAAYNNSLYEMNQLNGQIAQATEDLDGSKKRLAEAQADLEERASQVYKSGNVAFMDVLVGVDDFSEFATRLDLWVRLLGQERAKVEAVEEAKDELAARKRELTDQREQRVAAVEKAIEQRERAEGAEKEAEEYLASLNAGLRDEMQARQDRQAELAAKKYENVEQPVSTPDEPAPAPDEPEPVPAEPAPEPVPAPEVEVEVEVAQVEQIPVQQPDLQDEQAAADRAAAAEAAATEAERLAEQRAAEREAAREAAELAAAEQAAAEEAAAKEARQDAKAEAEREAELAAQLAAERQAEQEAAEREAELAAQQAAAERAAAQQAADEREAARIAAQRRAELEEERQAERDEAAAAEASASAQAAEDAEAAAQRREERLDAEASASASAAAQKEDDRPRRETTGSASASAEASASASAAPVRGGRASGSGSSVISEGQKYLGTPYVLGGMESCVPYDMMDCSCYTMTVYSEFGIALPDSPGGQMGYGSPVRGAPVAGDLLFWSEDGSGVITHVGIAMGDGTAIHASTYTGNVTQGTPIDSIPGYVGARRLL